MSTYLQNIIREEMLKALKEEELPLSPFTEAEEKFLAKFVELGTQSLGILYTANDVGIREFLMRSGNDFNLTPDILGKLMKDGIVSIVPYGGYARNEDYTIKCNLPLDELEGLSSGDAKPEGDDTATPDESVPAEPDLPDGPPQESISAADLSKLLVSEQKRHTSTRVYTNKSRALRRLPKGYVVYLEKIIKILGQKLHTDLEKQHLVADILDNLAHNFGLTPKQVYKSFIFYNSQNRLKNVVREQLENDEDMIKLKNLVEQTMGKTKTAAVDKKISARGDQKVDSVSGKEILATALVDKNVTNWQNWLVASIPSSQYIKMTRSKMPFQSRVALAQFSQTSLDAFGADWDKFVEKYGVKKIEKFGTRVRVEASFSKIPGQQVPGVDPQITNQRLLIDCKSLYKDKQVSGVGTEELVYTKLKEFITGIAQANADSGGELRVGIADYQVFSSTSKVPSNPKNSVLAAGRAKDMGSSFTTAVARLQKEMGVYLGDMKALAASVTPNQGPDWPDKDAEGNRVQNTTAAKTAAYGPQGQRNDHYENTYGPSRKSYITVSVSVVVSTPEVPAQEIGGADNANWSFYIKDKTKPPKPPRIPRIPPGTYKSKQKPGSCFSFADPSKLKKIAPLMAFGKGTRSSEKQFARQVKNL